MRVLTLGLATASLLALAGHTQAQPAGETLTQQQVQQLLVEQGYTRIKDVEFDDGLWEAKATSGNGKKVELRIDPVRGRVYVEDTKAISRLSEQDVNAALTTQGYSNIRNLKFKDGLWHAKATNSQSHKKELKIDPEDATIISVQND